MSNLLSITVSGIPCRPLGCEISYGVNQIPMAYVTIDPTYDNGSLLNNVEVYRRATCNIKITTSAGTLDFPCLFDGLSYSMGPGSYGYTAIFKSKFQVFRELYPYAPGIHPDGINPYYREPFSGVATTDTQIDGGTAAFVQAAFQSALGDIGNNIVRAFISAIKAVIINQAQGTAAQVQVYQTTNASLIQNLLPTIASPKNPGYARSLAVGNELLDLIDTTAADQFAVQSDVVAGLSLFSQIFMNSNTASLWDLLLNGLNTLGCCVVVGATKLFVVPEAYFLKPNSRQVPSNQQRLDQMNFASPGYYNDISFNDCGYRNIGAVIVTTAPYTYEYNGQVEAAPMYSSLPSNYCLTCGSYPSAALLEEGNTVSQGAILVLAGGPLLNLYVSYFPADMSAKKTIRPVDETSRSSFSTAVSYDGIAQSYEAQDSSQKQWTASQQEVLDNFALAKFLQMKYGDRTGSLSLLYDPKWVPGTTGTAFSRHPEPDGAFVDFFVTQVTHSFRIGTNDGSITTSVSFVGGRMGKDPFGVDSNLLYNYSSQQMSEFQSSFYGDTWSST